MAQLEEWLLLTPEVCSLNPVIGNCIETTKIKVKNPVIGPFLKNTNLEVMERDCGFESQHWILDGRSSHYFVLKFYCSFEKDRK